MSAAAVTAVTVIVVGLFFVSVALFLFFLSWRNSHPKPAPLEKLENKKVKIALFILKDIVVPLIGLAFFIITTIGLRNKNKWGDLNMKDIEIAFYFFQAVKFLIIIFTLVTERFDTLDDQIAIKLSKIGVRSDWKELLESLIFIPSVIIDGMLINAEFYIGDSGNAFAGDGIVLLVIDTILWVLLCNKILLKQYSNKNEPPYQIKEFGYALFSFYYTVLLVFLFIVEHKRVINVSRMNLTTPLIIILVNSLTHAYVCAYSSMMAQGITMFDKALRGSQARVTQLKIFINYLRIAPLPILITLFFLGYTIWLYVSVWIFCMNGHRNLQNVDSDEAEGMIKAVYYLVLIFTAFLCVNLLHAIIKRFGGWLNWRYRIGPICFDCSSYAEKINTILSQCTANFHLDHRAQVSITSTPSSSTGSGSGRNSSRK